MKFFAVFASVLALAAGAPWTLQDLSSALQNPNTNPEYIPYLEDALNQLMNDIYAGKPVVSIVGNNRSKYDYVAFYDHRLGNKYSCLSILKSYWRNESIAVIMPTVTHWTLDKLSSALQDPNTDPALVPYLEYALNEIMTALFNGQDMDTIAVVVPVDLKPVQEVPGAPVPIPVIVDPTPVLPVPEIPAPEIPVPDLPAPEAPLPAVSSPLVQIIINVNSQQQIIEPTPVQVVDVADNISVNPVDVIAVQPPTPEVVRPPVDVIAVQPPTPEVVRPPVDVIAIHPPTPEVVRPPVDVIAIQPIEQV